MYNEIIIPIQIKAAPGRVAIQTVVLENGQDISGIGHQAGVTIPLPEQILFVQALAGEKPGC
jgi:hypothetical protein